MKWDGLALKPGSRAGFGLIALGHGLGKMVDETNASFLFGCTSIETEDPTTVAVLQQYFIAEGAASLTNVCPHADHRLAGLAAIAPEHLAATAEQREALIEQFVPPLLKGYLRAGAAVAPEPSHDPHFKCVDFFTVLDLRQQIPGFMSRYAPNAKVRVQEGRDAEADKANGANE